MNETMQQALNEQIKNELYSAYLYLAMSAYFEDSNLPGMARWMRLQAQEEVQHAMKIFNFIFRRHGRVVLQAIDQPPTSFDSPLAVFRQVLEHEQWVTSMINRLYDQAVKENDYPTQTMLHWFIDEQVEEEKTAADIVGYLEQAQDHMGALLMLDHRLGQRQG